jgi:MoxR-like ATPase
MPDMLVGPPGTGKSTLVEQMVRESAEQPEAYGMTYGHELSIVTPDESWTARDLVGGTTIGQDGELQFAPGHVLQAIAADKWLLLDEANRADLDRIFGAMLTWLAGQQVSVGRDTPGSSAEIILTWSDQARSEVVDFEPADGRAAATVYRAGREWRLLGTYNSLDAYRVFRLGLALGRRFAQIPVPPPSSELFRQIVQQRVEGILENQAGQRVADVVARIYEVHSAVRALALGPALFLTIPDYVEAGLRGEDAHYV